MENNKSFINSSKYKRVQIEFTRIQPPLAQIIQFRTNGGSSNNGKNGKKVKCNSKNLCVIDYENSGTIQRKTKLKKKWLGERVR